MFGKTCRTCNVSATSFVSLFEYKVDNEVLKDILLFCTSIKVTENNTLSQFICSSCLELLITSYKFIRKCQENDQKLQYALNEKQWNNSHLSPEINVESCTDSCETESYLVESLSDNSKIKSNEIIQQKSKLQCDLCGKTFTKKSTLVYHLRGHSGQKNFKCKDCDKTFSTSSQLSFHQRSHNGFKPHFCKICSKKFSKSSNLNVHLLTHENKKRFSCNVCEKKFSQKTHLTSHQYLHSGLKPFCCDCGANFVTESNLKRHAIIHKGVKNYLCNFCGNLFSSCNDLNRHLVAHNDKKKEFTCNICFKHFTRSTSLYRHRKKVH